MIPPMMYEGSNKTQVTINLTDPQYTTLFTQLNAGSVMTPLLTALGIPTGFQIAQVQVDFINHTATVICTPVTQ